MVNKYSWGEREYLEVLSLITKQNQTCIAVMNYKLQKELKISKHREREIMCFTVMLTRKAYKRVKW